MALKPAGGKYEGVWINKLKNGDISYYINYRDENGKPVKVQVGKKTIASDFSARDAYAKLIEVKYKLQHDQEPTIKGGRTSKIKLDDLWQEFFIYAKANKKSWTIDEQNYNKHIKPAFGNKAVKNLKSLEFEKFKSDLVDKGLKAQTVKHQLTLIRTIINYAIKHDILKNFTNPLSNGKVKMPDIDNKRLAYLTKDEAKEILAILQSTHTLTYHLTVLLLFTGARFSEITGASAQKNKAGEAIPLKWSDVNLNNKTIFFKKTKNGNECHIAMNDTLVETIQYLYDNKVNDNVITNSVGGIILRMPDYFMSAVESVIGGNKIKDSKNKITAHSLRHTHASWLAEAGLDILQIKEQLGHKNIEMTMRYAHLIPNIRHEATRELSL
ncbi:tyrosine-type recombinase/integrase [Sulfurimonas aquatica]|uniref:Tyrosine-type recombinase/integrase n=1 Tax=Sulfurimonas aquatica TaxID=2672570 RepID=A0A975GBP6_9BACT|nr:site-specific integrase [Sulfurimonas aquatica]QSZ40775.1 tyrosine-type recombinase/integrase [Sulfurimonas aquatica]